MAHCKSCETFHKALDALEDMTVADQTLKDIFKFTTKRLGYAEDAIRSAVEIPSDEENLEVNENHSDSS